MNPSEQRRYRRLAIDQVARCQTNFSCKDRSYSDRQVVSLSAGGAFIALTVEEMKEMTVGDTLDSISLSHSELHQIKPQGIVVYKLQRPQIMGIGVAFQGLTSPQIRHLDEFVNNELRDTPLFKD